MVTNRKAQIISKPRSNVSLAQAIEDCKKEVERNVNAESDPILRVILGGRMMLSPSDVADGIVRKSIEAMVVNGDNGGIDPVRTTVTKAEAARLVDATRRGLANAKAKYLADKESNSDPNTLPERQAGVYRLDKPAALAGITALEAANHLLTRDGELLERYGIPCKEVDAPPLAKRLLTLEEMQAHGSEDIHRTIHPLREWLQRARAKGIEYIPGLDFAVAQYSANAIRVEPKAPSDGAEYSGELSVNPETAISDAEPQLENWMMRVQEEAAKRWRAQRGRGCNPTRHSLKDELATWCRENNVVAKSGINPSADYLYRHVLNKRHWMPPTN